MKPNRIAVLAAAATLAACVNPELSFKPGVTAGTEVIQRMGPAHHVWPEPDGGATWEDVYGPSGTYMTGVDRAGVVTRIEQVLSEKYFSRVRSGMKPEEVRRRAMGRPSASWNSPGSARRSGTTATGTPGTIRRSSA